MSLKIYNSLGRKFEDFKPITPGQVKMYVCGPTVYSYLHVGNFRGPVFFNFVKNWLEFSGYKVEYALNFTDVDDKIIKRAGDENVSATEIAERYIAEYKTDFKLLGLRSHDHNPKVSDYMPQIIQMISGLLEKNKAYAAAGDVNYAIEKFPEYGKLSGRKVDDMLEGVRIDVSDKKQSPLDFALWKSAKPAENLRGSIWPSPWGEGRPGWHIECSAMVKGLFGDQIDIHGGGLDLMFPHHENEIAQSEGCNEKHYVNYWMHWNMLNFSGNKMSKSVGNVVTMREFLEKNHPEIYKWMMLSVHYRSVADFSEQSIENAVGGLAKVYSALSLANSFEQAERALDAKYAEDLNLAWAEITEAFNHDFGTPNAFAVMFEQIRKFNSTHRRGMKNNPVASGKAKQFKDFILKFGKLLSLFQEPADQFLLELDNKLLDQKKLVRSDIDVIVAERSAARSAKDFAKSDELRKKLTEFGIAVSDLPECSFWEVAK
jgi:cysteinyl-tRNA synthetase